MRTIFDTGSAWTGWHVYLKHPRDPRGRELHFAAILDPNCKGGPCLVFILPLKPGRYCTPDRIWTLFDVRLRLPLPSLRWRNRAPHLYRWAWVRLNRFWNRLDGRYGVLGRRLHAWNRGRTS